DPNIHQAVVQDDNPDFESGEITQELQKGYKLKDRVLRPSMVKVNQ
ncbi:nucleotide exchange factor GrpE, partial [Staphylococcus epidermidis]